MDEQYRRCGYGRCTLDQHAGRWVRAEAPRECAQLVAIDAAQIRSRRRHLANFHTTETEQQCTSTTSSNASLAASA